MERRRKALGLSKLYSKDEEKKTTSGPNPAKKTTTDNVLNELEGKRHQGHRSGSVTPRNSKQLKDIAIPRANLTPKQTTPKSHQKLSLVRAESPSSPLISPSQHAMVIHKMFRSPEVEVSWDWGCSQVVNEIVPVRRLTRSTQSQPVPVPDSVPLSYPRLPPNKQMSEEENQKRLAFYKNILSKSLKRNEKESPKNNNNVDEDVKADSSLNNTTPKRPLKHKTESTIKKDQVNAIFDDSANDFMLECSQAIEEQLRNGEICLGSVVNIEIGSKKHPYSPAGESENAVKKVCHGKTKQNLFPESTKSPDHKHVNHDKKQCLSLKSPKVKPSPISSNCGKTFFHSNEINSKIENENDILFMRPTKINRPPLVKNCFEEDSSSFNQNERISSQSVASNDNDKTVLTTNSKREFASSDKAVSVRNSSNQEAKRLLQNKMGLNNKVVTNEKHTNINVNASGNTLSYDSVNKFRRSQNGVNGLVNKVTANYSCKASGKEGSLHNNIQAKGVPNITSKSSVKVTKPKGVDVTPLLDDGFDMDLCSIDFDSLCCSSQPQPKEPQIQAVVKTVPKLCSGKEIEAKRLAALNRLKMKKKK